MYSGDLPPTWNTTNSMKIHVFWLSTPYMEYYEFYENPYILAIYPHVEYYESY